MNSCSLHFLFKLNQIEFWDLLLLKFSLFLSYSFLSSYLSPPPSPLLHLIIITIFIIFLPLPPLPTLHLLPPLFLSIILFLPPLLLSHLLPFLPLFLLLFFFFLLLLLLLLLLHLLLLRPPYPVRPRLLPPPPPPPVTPPLHPYYVPPPSHNSIRICTPITLIKAWTSSSTALRKSKNPRKIVDWSWQVRQSLICGDHKPWLRRWDDIECDEVI